MRDTASIPIRLAHSPKETAALLGVSRETVYVLIRSGKLPSILLGSRRLIRRDAIDALLADCETEAS